MEFFSLPGIELEYIQDEKTDGVKKEKSQVQKYDVIEPIREVM